MISERVMSVVWWEKFDRSFYNNHTKLQSSDKRERAIWACPHWARIALLQYCLKTMCIFSLRLDGCSHSF